MQTIISNLMQSRLKRLNSHAIINKLLLTLPKDIRKSVLFGTIKGETLFIAVKNKAICAEINNFRANDLLNAINFMCEMADSRESSESSADSALRGKAEIQQNLGESCNSSAFGKVLSRDFKGCAKRTSADRINNSSSEVCEASPLKSPTRRSQMTLPLAPSAREGESNDSFDLFPTYFFKKKVSKKDLDLGNSRESQDSPSLKVKYVWRGLGGGAESQSIESLQDSRKFQNPKDSRDLSESQKIFRLIPQNDKMLDCHENPCGFSHNDGVGNCHDSAMPNLAMTKMATCHESTSTDSRNSHESNTISHESRANLEFLRKIKQIRAYIPKDILERKAQEKREVIFVERYTERAKGDFKIAPNSVYSEIFQAIKRAIKRNIDEFKRAN